MRIPCFVLAALTAAFPIACHAGGLGTLIQAGKSMDEIQRTYDKETAVYYKIKEALEKGGIKNGMTQADVRKYGEPVAIVSETAGKRHIWVYRPGTTDLLKKPKIRLFFDGNGALEDTAVLE